MDYSCEFRISYPKSGRSLSGHPAIGDGWKEVPIRKRSGLLICQLLWQACLRCSGAPSKNSLRKPHCDIGGATPKIAGG